MASVCSDALIAKYKNTDLRDSSEFIILQNDKTISYPDLFKEFCKLVEDNFYSREIIKKKFIPLKQSFARQVDNVDTDKDFIEYPFLIIIL